MKRKTEGGGRRGEKLKKKEMGGECRWPVVMWWCDRCAESPEGWGVSWCAESPEGWVVSWCAESPEGWVVSWCTESPEGWGVSWCAESPEGWGVSWCAESPEGWDVSCCVVFFSSAVREGEGEGEGEEAGGKLHPRLKSTVRRKPREQRKPTGIILDVSV